MTDTVSALINSDRIEEAVEAASRLLEANPSSAQLLFLRGKALWRLGRRAEAMTDYAGAVALDPSGPAAKALEHARDIAAFFNPDMFNP
ncbi:MAG: tetratricopeptide repeat protein [Pseudoflavonifractor sp.]|nr:tetratricopeptide repeat protein [Alloprevotella sp.]MCM1116696.1 tetratricopeptide repeat protein [Pseudoflavonifractor sp.]